MRPILAKPPLLTFRKQILKDILYRLSMIWIRFIERHHVDEDDMPLVHEEIAEEVEGLGFADPVGLGR
jgi:hypothetical protein